MSTSPFVPGSTVLTQLLSNYSDKFAFAARAAADHSSLIDIFGVLDEFPKEFSSLISSDGVILASWLKVPSGHGPVATNNWVRTCIRDVSSQENCRIAVVGDGGVIHASDARFESGQRALVTVECAEKAAAQAALLALEKAVADLSKMRFDQDGFVA